MYLNVINKTTQLLEDNVGVNLPGFTVGKYSLNTLKQALIIKEMGQFDYKLRSSMRRTVKRLKRQALH